LICTSIPVSTIGPMQIFLATLPAKYYWINEVESKTKPYGLSDFPPLSMIQPVSF
jgi:hypothetical protein